MIKELITPMNSTIARDAICEALAKERDFQLKLAQKAGLTNDEIKEKIDFTIYPKRFRIPDINDMPCVYIYFDRADFPSDEQYTNENYALLNLRFDYFCAGNSEELINADDLGDFVTPADTAASDRLDYLTAQLYKILDSEGFFTKNTNGLIDHVKLKNWERIITPEELNQAATVLGASFVFEVEINEPAYYCDGLDIKEFYIKLSIRDEFISPEIKIFLKEKVRNK